MPEEVRGQIRSVDVYDPSAGSGTLLMNVAHVIGEDKCMIYTQDISQKSSNLLRLNLSLNNLVHSLNNVVQGNTILSPYHKDASDRLKNLISSFPIRRLNWISAISAINWKAMKTANAFLQAFRKSRRRIRIRWKSTSFLSSISCLA